MTDGNARKELEDQFADILWECTRNPLAHTLGVYLPLPGEPSVLTSLARGRGGWRRVAIEDGVEGPRVYARSFGDVFSS